MVVTINGKRHWLWRDVDNGGEVFDFRPNLGQRRFDVRPTPSATSLSLTRNGTRSSAKFLLISNGFSRAIPTSETGAKPFFGL